MGHSGLLALSEIEWVILGNEVPPESVCHPKLLHFLSRLTAFRPLFSGSDRLFGQASRACLPFFVIPAKAGIQTETEINLFVILGNEVPPESVSLFP